MKTGFIFILYKTPPKEKFRLKKEVRELGFSDYQIYFVDNTDTGRGYAAGVNIGIKTAIAEGCKLFVVANPDISLSELTFKKTIQTAKHFDVWGLAMKQENQIYYGGVIDRWRMSGGLITAKPKKRFSKVDFVSGSLMFIKIKVVDEIGYFDESYFMYYEEVDYCFRANKSGFKVGVDSGSFYRHFELSRTNAEKEKYLFKNRLKFLFKYGSGYQKLREIVRAPKTLYEEIVKRPFYLNFLSLNLSSLLNKILHFILFILLINYFKPEDYAVYTLAWTHIGLFSPLLDFGTTSYGLVNLNLKNTKRLSDLFSFRMVLSILTFMLTLMFILIFKYQKTLYLPIFLTSFVIFSNMFSGTFLIISSIEHKSYFASLISMIFQTILVSVMILFIVIYKKIHPLFWIIATFYTLYGFANYILIKRRIDSLNFIFDLRKWFLIARQSVVFLIISLLAGFYSKVDVLILNYFKGQKAVGIYSAGYRFLDALMFIVVAYNVASIPIFSDLAATGQKEKFIGKLKKDFLMVTVLGGFIAFGFYFLSPILLPFVIKGNYSSSLPVLRIIIFSLPLILLTSVALNGIYALKRAYYAIYVFLFQVGYNLLLNYFFIPKYSYYASAWISLSGELLNTLILFFFLKKAYENRFG
ncbi:oligosaccharide flippase family protein [Patescibacteria group bacterium]|nr:oligosaccharide flippase family protein [Patescibacteria group bacterium]